MSRFAVSLLIIIIALVWLSIQDDKERTEKEIANKEYFDSLPPGIQDIILKIKSDSLRYSNDTQYTISKNVLILFEKDTLIKLLRDIKEGIDYLSTTDTNQLETIILVQRDTEVVGSYYNGSQAIRNDFKLTFINYPSFTVFKTEILEGGPPPESISRRPGSDNPGYGSFPSESRIIERINDNINGY